MESTRALPTTREATGPVYLNRRFSAGEALGNACRMFRDDALFLEVSHPRERFFEGEVAVTIVMVEPELFVLELRLRVV